MRGENTSDLILDTIDYTPNLFFGFTAVELGICFMVSSSLCAFPFTFISGMLTNTILYGFVVSALVGGFISFFAAQKAMILKKDRPSYMMWLDMARYIQDKGILGVKINMNMVKDEVWEIQRSEPKK